MNKTLLLIICDFLLLNLLALTRWEKVEAVEKRKAPVPEVNANSAKSATDDLVEAMRIALADEKSAREKLATQMTADVREREKTLSQLQQQRDQLEANLRQTQQSATETSERLKSVAQQASQAQEKLKESERTLTARQAEAERQQKALADSLRAGDQEKKQLLETLRLQQLETERRQAEVEKQRQAAAALEKEKRDAEKQVAALNTAVKVAESEKSQLQKNVTDLKQEVTLVRQEKAKLQEQTSTLASGVSQLAAKSGELSKEVREIRENTPINANLLYSDFLSNRVAVTVSAVAPGVFSPNAKQKDTPTVLIADGPRILALLHIRETPFTLSTPTLGMEKVAVRITAEGRDLKHGNLFTALADPRIMAVPVDRTSADALGIKVYPLSKNPYKFTEAVLFSRSGKYGEVEFKLDPKLPDFVKMKNRVANRLFGEFAPNAGDIVLSKTGEVLGVMVNDDYCAVLKNLAPRPGFDFDATLPKDAVAAKLAELFTMLQRLPLNLQ
jgi:X-X-X-Leu-X-X-Gly heptad repeat protein